MYYPYMPSSQCSLNFSVLSQQSILVLKFIINKFINLQVRFVFHCMVDREATDAAVEKVVQVIETILKSK
jgi:hypothetical protein